MAYPRDDNPPLAVFSKRPTLGAVPHAHLARPLAPVLQIDTSSQQPKTILNPYEGFELILQQYPLQNKQASNQPVQQHGRHTTQQGQRHDLPPRHSQQPHGRHIWQQMVEEPKTATPDRQQRANSRYYQRTQSQSWQNVRQGNRFPPPVRPASISPHPDHSSYPSFTYIQPNFGMTHDHVDPLQTLVSGTVSSGLPKAQSMQDKEPLTAIPTTYDFRGSRQIVLNQPKRSRSGQQSQETQSRSLPIRQQKMTSKRLKRAGRGFSGLQPLGSRAPTSVPTHLSPNFSVAPPFTSTFGRFETDRASPMPSPPHPSANFFPFLKPVSATHRGGVWGPEFRPPGTAFQSVHNTEDETQTPTSRQGNRVVKHFNNPNNGEPEARPLARYKFNFQGPTLILPPRRPPTSGTVTSSMPTPRASDFLKRRLQHDVSSSYAAETHTYRAGQQSGVASLVLPYGHSTPVVYVLNQPPFVDFVRGLLRDVCSQKAPERHFQPTMPQEEEASQPPVGTAASFASFAFPSALPQLPTPKARPLIRLPHTEPPNASHLAACVEKYISHVQVLYHVMPPQRLDSIVDSFLRRCQAPDQKHGGSTCHTISQTRTQPQVELAIEYLVFALGGLCWAKWDNTIFESGPVFSDRATNILRQLSEGLLFEERRQHLDPMASTTSCDSGTSLADQSMTADLGLPNSVRHLTGTQSASPPTPCLTMDLARAYLLAALSCGQLAKMQEAANHVHRASSIIHFLIRQPGGQGGQNAVQGLYGRSLAEYEQHPHRLAEDERQLVSLYWTCVHLEYEINTETGQAPSELLRYQSKVPTPDFDISRLTNNTNEDATIAGIGLSLEDESNHKASASSSFKIQTSLRGHLNNIYRAAFEQPVLPKQASNVAMAVSGLRHQFDSMLLGQSDRHRPGHKPIQTARALSAYWEARSYGALPRLMKPRNSIGMDEMAEVVCSMAETVRAFHCLEEDRLILPNAFGTAMLQCRYVLLLFAASRTLPNLAAFIDDTTLAELVSRTLMSFQDLLVFRGISFGGIVEAARQVLKIVGDMLQQQEKQAGPVVSEPAPAPAPVQSGTTTMPELSLYCPSFTTASGPATAIPTASTMDSFISFPTPSSPHLFPFSALTSPQHSPSISATSASPSPTSPTFISTVEPAPCPIPPSATHYKYMPPDPLPPLDMFPRPLERMPAAFADFPGFVHHLGLGL